MDTHRIRNSLNALCLVKLNVDQQLEQIIDNCIKVISEEIDKSEKITDNKSEDDILGVGNVAVPPPTTKLLKKDHGSRK